MPTRPPVGVDVAWTLGCNGDWLQDRYVADGWSVQQIGAVGGCSDRTVRRLLAEAGIARRGNPRTHRLLGDPEWLRRRYVEQHVSVSAIAAELSCHQSAVYEAMAGAGIPRRRRRSRTRQFAQLDDAAWLRRRYVDEGSATSPGS